MYAMVWVWSATFTDITLYVVCNIDVYEWKMSAKFQSLQDKCNYFSQKKVILNCLKSIINN